MRFKYFLKNDHYIAIDDKVSEKFNSNTCRKYMLIPNDIFNSKNFILCKAFIEEDFRELMLK